MTLRILFSATPALGLLALRQEQPYIYTAIEGIASTTTDGGPELIQELSQRYNGGPPTPSTVRMRCG